MGTGTGVTRGLGQVPVIDILYPETQTSGPQSCQGWQSDGIPQTYRQDQENDPKNECGCACMQAWIAGVQ